MADCIRNWNERKERGKEGIIEEGKKERKRETEREEVIMRFTGG